MRTFLVALLALAVAPSLAKAANSKGVTIIRVENHGADFLAVIDKDFTFPEGSNPTLNVSAFFKAGGQLVAPRSFTLFVVKNGSNGTVTRTISGAFVKNLGSRFTIGGSDSTTVTVPKGGTTTVVATEDSDGDANLNETSP